jgi:hypothetical protein
MSIADWLVTSSVQALKGARHSLSRICRADVRRHHIQILRHVGAPPA